MACIGRSLRSSPEAGYKTLMRKEPSLYPEERSILTSEDKGTQSGI